MKYKNLIIKCDDEEEFKKLQKHLFYHKYSWIENNIRNHTIMNFKNVLVKMFWISGASEFNHIYVVIGTDDILQFDHREAVILPLAESKYKLITYKAFERSLKIKKINNDTELNFNS